MTACLHPSCGRDDLPMAPAFPPRARVSCAHVNAKGEPCPFSPGVDVYDLEALTLIVTEDVLWDPMFTTGQAADGDQAAAAGTTNLGTAGINAIARAGSIPAPVTYDKAEREHIAAHGLEGAAPSQVRASMMKMTPAPAPAKPVKKAVSKKAPVKTATPDVPKAEVDIDDWHPAG